MRPQLRDNINCEGFPPWTERDVKQHSGPTRPSSQYCLGVFEDSRYPTVDSTCLVIPRDSSGPRWTQHFLAYSETPGRSQVRSTQGCL